jgi:nitrate reductase NapE component
MDSVMECPAQQWRCHNNICDAVQNSHAREGTYSSIFLAARDEIVLSLFLPIVQVCICGGYGCVWEDALERMGSSCEAVAFVIVKPGLIALSKIRDIFDKQDSQAL